MIFNWKSAAYIRKQLPPIERTCHLKVHFSFISSRLYCLTASSLSLYLTCSSCFVILSLTFISLSFMCLCSVFRWSGYSSVFALRISLSSQHPSIMFSSVWFSLELHRSLERRVSEGRIGPYHFCKEENVDSHRIKFITFTV